MIKIKIKAIAEVIAAEVINLDSEIEFSGQIVIDSRNVKPGDLFVAIKGDRQDGHDFAQAAIQAGAVAVVVAKRLSEVPQLLVKETSNAPENFSQPGIWAMAKLAKYLHRELTNLKTIAITGSSGKTTTKDLIAQMSELIGESIFTYKSSNNEIGLPLTVFRCNEKTKLLILEMGARHTGNIKYLTDIAKPNYSIITHIGTAHLEIFGSLENLRITKAEIIKDLTAHDWAILNLDDKNTEILKTLTKAKILTVGTTQNADLFAKDIDLDELGRPSFTMCFRGHEAKVRLQLTGEHNVLNALAATAPYLLEDIELSKIAELLSSATATSPLRMQLVQLQDEILLLNDSYNANPESMNAALVALEKIGTGKRKIAILGEMRELGEKHEQFHEEIGHLVAKLNVDQLLVVGEGAKGFINGARAVDSWLGEATLLENNQALASYAKELIKPHDVILLKASRAIALEEVAQALIEFKGEA